MPFDRKMELVARLEAGERAADLAAEAGVTAAAVSGWRRRLREEGALSLMTLSLIHILLGHASLTTTQIYTHVTPERLKEIHGLAHPRA